MALLIMNIQRGPFSYLAVGAVPTNANACNQYILTRILLGNVNIKNNHNIYKQSIDYSKLTPVLQALPNGKVFLDFIQSEGIAQTSAEFISRTITDNRPFFEDLLWEYSNYFDQTGKGAHTSAFIFLYRIIERASYSVPALYFSCSNDYYATFSDLQKILNEGGQGELGLLKKFLNQNNFIDQNEKSVVFDINYMSNYGLEIKYFNVVRTKVQPVLVSQDVNIFKMQISFINILDFFIKIRNRFFHSRTGDGQNNIRAHEVENTDELFSILNPIFCSFASFVVLRSISKKYQK